MKVELGETYRHRLFPELTGIATAREERLDATVIVTLSRYEYGKLIHMSVPEESCEAVAESRKGVDID